MPASSYVVLTGLLNFAPFAQALGNVPFVDSRMQ